MTIRTELYMGGGTLCRLYCLCTMYSVQTKVYCTLCKLYCFLYTVQTTTYAIHCTSCYTFDCTKLCDMYTVQYTVYVYTVLYLNCTSLDESTVMKDGHIVYDKLHMITLL